MPRLIRRLLLAACLLPLAASAAPPEGWGRLEVRDLDGRPLDPAGRWLVVVFLSPECPVANAEIPALNALAAEFGPHGVAFVGAYADPTLATADLRRHTHDYQLAFPAADDRTQRLKRAAGATCTPEVGVFARDGTLLYRGRIDDRVEDFGAARPVATREDLREVLTALLAGRPGPFPFRPGFGCAIPAPAAP